MRKIIPLIVLLLLAAICWQNSTYGDNLSKNKITVGPQDADIVGTDSKAIQIAIDAMAYGGGGTVYVLPGEYTLYNSIYLRSNVAIIGDRDKTILKRGPAISSRLLIDADVGQKEITPKDASLFKVGMGISLRSNRLMNAMTGTPLTITRIENGVLYVNDYIVHDYTADLDSWGKGGHDGLAANVFPMIFGHRVENVIVDGFTVDSKTDIENPGWERVRIGSVYFRTVKNSVIRNVKSINAQGDGLLVARACKNIIVEDCESAYNTFHGMHPGSHATHVTVQRCHFHHNGSDGLYICWGVKTANFLITLSITTELEKTGNEAVSPSVTKTQTT
ncbi:right-handed parallel beta-helix repeat-containing protein [bacterium]|nr:right-handed parallel beta-helix repeat-containing protein [bacterium]